MATNILLDVIKTDFNIKQKDGSSNYSTKDTSDSFMKIFETANKSYNFNNEKMEGFTSNKENYLQKSSSYAEQYNRNWEENLSFNNEEAFGNFYNPTSANTENRNSYTKNQMHQEKVSSEPQKPGTEENKPSLETKELHKTGDNEASQKEPAVDSEKTGKNNEKSAENSEKTAESDVKPTDKQTQETAKNSKTKGQEAEKQSQASVNKELAKDTAGKLQLENLKVEEKEVKVADKKQPAEKEVKLTNKQQPAEKEVKLMQNNGETDSVKKKAVTLENGKAIESKKQQDTQKIAEQKIDDKPDKKTENLKTPEVREKDSEKKQELPELTNKTKNDRPEKDSKTQLPPTSKHLEAKEELKIENIKVTANSEAQKVTKDIMDTTKQGQQNSSNEAKANINHAGDSDSGAQKVDLQKTAQFEKVLNSKQTETTQKSVLNQVKNASAQLGSGKSEVSINLRPDNLGRLNINLVSQKGEVTAQITAENNQVKEMLA